MVQRLPTAPRRSRRLTRFLVGVLGVAALGGVGFAGWFRYSYGSWPGMEVGGRITWCERDWRVEVTDMTRVEAENQDPDRPLRPVFDYPPVLPQSQVYAVLTSTAQRARDPEAGCAPRLYVQTGPDRFSSYVVDGARTD